MAARVRRLRRSDRLLHSRDFQRVARQGRRLASRHFVVLIAPTRCEEREGDRKERGSGVGEPVRRLGVTASRKVGNAVIRNRVKRAIREWFRTEGRNLERDVDVVVIARSAAAALAPTAIRDALNALVSEEAARCPS